MLTTRGTLALLAAFTVFVAIALPLDRNTDLLQQSVLGLTAWVFLAIALWLQPRDVRVQVLVLVAVATVLEVIGSIIWGAYRYRLGNLPLYVPAAHGLFYLSALRASSLPIVQRHGRAIVVAVTAFATLYMLRNLTLALPDLLGFVTWAIFLRFILRGTAPVLYAVSFVMTTALELYGTGLGIWTWQPVLPVLMLPAANPPSGVGAGYAAMDALTRRIVKRLREPGASARVIEADAA
ncbi:MAG: hypothetical protein M3R54_12670 [Chloroflexota bacterium]|nr:hypothetical protein [Chloroflexota bacterium]